MYFVVKQLLLFYLTSLIILPATPQNLTSSRLVITFQTRADNLASNAGLVNATLVKRYGRRLVLDLRRTFDLAEEADSLRSAMLAVEHVEMDYLVSVNDVSVDEVSDAVYSDDSSSMVVTQGYAGAVPPLTQWNLKDSEPYSIHAEKVWASSNSTPDVVVAVIDTGLATPAREYFLHVVDGYDFISDVDLALDWDGRDPDATDPGDWGDYCPTPSWHGTRVASILAARHDNKFGMRGVAQNCSVMPVRVLGLCKMGYANDVTDAIVWAAGGNIDGVPPNPLPAKILSLSLAGQGDCPSYLQSAIDLAVSLGSVVITAAGNNNKDASGYFPANCKGVIAVAASTRQGTLAGYSNYGTIVSLSAPGGDAANPIMTLRVDSIGTDLQIFNGVGTSFAVPHEAGIKSLMLHVGLIETLYIPMNEIEFALRCGQGIVSIRQPIKKNYTVDVYKELNPLLNIPSNSIYTNNNTVWTGGIYGPLVFTQICKQGTYADDDASIKWTKNTIPTGAGTYNIQCPGSQFISSITRYSVCGVGIQVQCNSRDASVSQKLACVGSGSCTGCTNTEISYGAPYVLAITPNGFYISTKVVEGGIEYDRIFDSGTDFGGPANIEYCPIGSVVVGLYGTLTGTLVNSVRIICRNMCPACPKGAYCTGGSIIRCAAGTYSDVDGAFLSSTCSSCSAGTYSTALGAISSATCSNCGVGVYSSDLGAVSSARCLQCAAGKYSTALGAVSSGTCSDCSAGTYSIVPGASASAQCTLCLQGTYSSITGVSSSLQCLQCLAGAFSTALGAASSSDCINCIKGTYSIVVGSISSASCISCDQGKYSSMEGANQACTLCPAGTFSSSVGASICTSCTDTVNYALNTGSSECTSCAATAAVCSIGQTRTACTTTAKIRCNTCPAITANAYFYAENSCNWKCNQGYYRSYSTTECIICSTYAQMTCNVGEYFQSCVKADLSEAAENSKCMPCTNGPSSLLTYTSNSDTEGVSNCLWSCNIGYFKSNSATCAACSTSCLVGKYNQGCSGTSSGTCTSCTCPAGQYSVGCSGLSSGTCTACTACGASQYMVGCSGTSSGTCTNCLSCSAGQYMTGCSGTSSGACTTCGTCTAGKYNAGCAGTSSGTCTDCTCPAGQYITGCSGTSSGTCTSCNAGYYRAAADSVGSCTQCPVGKYSTVVGASSSAVCTDCTSCPDIGQYTANCGVANSGSCAACTKNS